MRLDPPTATPPPTPTVTTTSAKRASERPVAVRRTEVIDEGYPLPSIHFDDGVGGRGPDVRAEVDENLLILGEDLVLWWHPEPDMEKHRPAAGKRVYTGRWLVGVSDGSANHLGVLAILTARPGDEVLRLSAETARAAWPTHVRIPQDHKDWAAKNAAPDTRSSS